MSASILAPRDYYNLDPVGAKRDLTGAGTLAYITQDQLHPPMVDDEEIWQDGRRWHEGSIMHTLDAAALCEFHPGQTVLDIGGGVGGPARLLVDYFDVDVVCTSISEEQLKTCQRINASKPAWKYHIKTMTHDCQKPFIRTNFNCVWSMNMLYHIESKLDMLQNARRSLDKGGRLMIDDWMLTPRATQYDRKVLGHHFISSHFAVREDILSLIASSGFRISHFQELGHIGRTHLAHHFTEQFDKHFRKMIIESNPEYGPSIAEHFCDAITATIDLYLQEKLTYCRILAIKE